MKEKKESSSLIRSLRPEDRPYEKCISFGPAALTEAELLAVILRSGAEGIGVLDLSRAVIDSFGADGLTGLCSATSEELTRIRGIGKVKAMQLTCIAELSRRLAHARRRSAAVFHSSREIAAYYMEDFRHERNEAAVLAMFDTKGRLLCDEIVARGTVNGAMISAREIFVCALSRRAVSIVLIHNHPSGDPTPSPEDIRLTVQIREAGKMIGIPLLDHLVIGDGRAVSILQMADEPQSGGLIDLQDYEDAA